MSQAGENLYEILKPLAYRDAELGYPLRNYCEALAQALQLVDDYVQPDSDLPRERILGQVVANHVTNPSWELNTAGWDTTGSWHINPGATYTRDTTDKVFGVACAKVVTPGTQVLEGIRYISLPVLAGKIYTFTAFIKRTAGSGNLRLGIGAPGIGSNTIIFTPTSNWLPYTVKVTCTASGFMQLGIATQSGTATAQTFWVDGAQVTEDIALPYADGDSEDALWEFDPHASRTIKNIIVSSDEPYPNWSSIVDVDRSPYEALGWLGQMVGVDIPKILSGETQPDHDTRVRAYIKTTPGFFRGSVPGMTAEAQKYLTGTKTVYFRERDTSPYHLTISTREDETPVEDWAATNLITNSSFESNTTNWLVTQGTLTRTQAVTPVFGLWSAAFAYTASGHKAEFQCTISGTTTGRVFTASIYVKGVGATIGKMASISLTELGGASGGAATTATATLTADWQRLTVTRTIVQNDRTSVVLGTSWISPASGDTVYIDGAQMEENPSATPHIFTDGSIASRSAGQGPVGTVLRAAKPAGIILNYLVVSGWDYFEIDSLYSSYTAIDTDFSSYTSLEVGP